MEEKLTFISNGKAFTNSLILAQGMGVDARSVRLLIDKYKADLITFGKLSFEMTSLKDSTTGQKTKVYLLTEEQATFVISLMKNTKQVVKFKKNLVEQFYEMRAVLDNLAQAKDDYKALSDAIYNYYGSAVNPHAYSNEANMINKIVLGMSAKQKSEELGLNGSKSLRQYLSNEQIIALDRLQQVDIYLISTGIPYKERKMKLIKYYESIADKMVNKNKDCA